MTKLVLPGSHRDVTLRTGQSSCSGPTRAVARAVLGLALLAASAAAQTAVAGAVNCSAVYRHNNGTTKDREWKAHPTFAKGMMVRGKSLIPSDTHWLVPGTEVIQDDFSDRIMCYQASSEKTPIYLKVVPTAAYLAHLKKSGLDVRIQAIEQKNSTDIMLLRDNIAAGVGTLVPLQNFYATQLAAVSIDNPYNPSNSDYNYYVPWEVVRMQFVVTDVANRTVDSTRFISTPDPAGLSIKIMAAADEGGALVIVPAPSSTVAVMTCAPPSVRIDRSGRDRADIDFGTVSLDRLRRGESMAYNQSFSIELLKPTRSACDQETRLPKMRFLAAGRYQHGMFEGELNDSQYPGNNAVAIQLWNGAEVVRGANRGDIDTGAFIPFDTGAKTFTATIKPRTGSADKVGPFLIPVTLEAFYH